MTDAEREQHDQHGSALLDQYGYTINAFGAAVVRTLKA